jgi:hypothetical protein
MICCNEKPCPAATTPYLVALQGPFGLVLHKDPDNLSQIIRITALMPADDKGRHKFRIQRQDQNTSKLFGFAVQQVKPPSTPVLCVGPGFCDFCVESAPTYSNALSKLLTIELSVPTRIIIPSDLKPLDVVFQSTNPGIMQRGYILEYDLDISPLQWVDTTSGFHIPLPKEGLLFEVGLDLKDPDDSFSSHALHFHNQHLLPFFGLQNDNNHVISTIFPPTLGTPPESTTTTTLECKAGGIIVGNPIG